MKPNAAKSQRCPASCRPCWAGQRHGSSRRLARGRRRLSALCLDNGRPPQWLRRAISRQHVLILFGYPAAHEHDAEQAVRAGLELCAAVRTLQRVTDAPLQCRVGIATGMVIVGDLIRVAQRRDREIVGDAPDLAVRLQISAQPDTVVIESATRRLIGNLFECRDLGAIDNGCDDEPLRRWQVLGERSSRAGSRHCADRR